MEIVFQFSTSSSNVSANGQGCVGVELEDSADFMVSVTLNSCTGLEDGQSRMYVMGMPQNNLFYMIAPVYVN